MPQIIVIRHSVAQANEQGILMGSKLNSPLSEKGIQIARAKAAALKSERFMPDKVYTSELLRAQQTAEIILEGLDADVEPARLTDLNERDFGMHDGKPYQSVIDAFDTHGENPPTIEPVKDFVHRVTRAWERIISETDETTLVVTHSNPEMVLQCLALEPERVSQFWELGDPDYCEGFTYNI